MDVPPPPSWPPSPDGPSPDGPPSDRQPSDRLPSDAAPGPYPPAAPPAPPAPPYPGTAAYGPAPGGAPTAGRSGMAIAALVLGIAGAVLCFVFVPSILALIFGLVAARDIKRSAAAGVPKQGAGMARAGWILGIAGLVIGVVFVIIAVVTDEDDTSVNELRVGDCLQMDDLGDVVRDIPTVDCDQRHDGEVYATGDLAGASYPGLTRVVDLVETECLDAFEPYVGTTYQDSELDVFYLYPPERTWRVNRGYLCIAYPVDGSTLVGSVEGSGR